MSATAPFRLVPLVALTLFTASPLVGTGGDDPSPAAVTVSGADPLGCPVTLLDGHRVRCDFLTGGVR